MRRKQIRTPSTEHDKRYYRWLFFLPIILACIGVFFVFEASSVRSFTESGDSFRYLKLQFAWMTIGIVLMVIFSHFDYRKLYAFSFIFMLGTIILLSVVLIPGLGHSAGGARRWIDLGFFKLQPTEFAKAATLIYLSSWFINPEKKRFFSFLVLLGLLMLLIILQPDMGTAIVIFSLSISIYYLAGSDLHYLLMLLPVAAGGFYVLAKTSPYRFRRIMAFFNPELDPLGITYHLNQILISLSAGGVIGRGFGASRQKYLFLPEAHTDSIFAIIGEEVGFIGTVALIVVFGWFLLNLYKVSVHAKDRFGKLLSGGIFALFGFQMIINLGSMVNLIPLTGVPLPFISYGGSHMLTSFMLVGIALNIAKQNKL